MIGAVMGSIDDYNSESKLIGYLGNQLVEGKLALILGAGVSMDFGLPDWPTLVMRLYAAQGAVGPSGLSLEASVDYFRNKFFSSDQPGFIRAVGTALYESITPDLQTLLRHKLLSALGALVMASSRGSASQVISFNFDDMLETYLAYHGFVTASVAEEVHWSTRADVTILHPHGFIPHEPGRSPSKGIVFDRTSYSQIVGDEARPWRQKMLTIMRSHTCLFIGLSGDDNNLDSWLVRCKQQHASLVENTQFWGVTFKTPKADPSANEAEAWKWQSRGIFPQIVTDYNDALPAFLSRVCQEAAQIRFR